jgi:disulfide bond formation protein DsbB
MWENRAMRHLPRAVFAFIAVACIAMDAYAILYLQEELGLEPCPMCILSRYTFFTIAGLSILAAIHGRAYKVYGTLVAVFAAIGIGISARHSWLQHNPPKIETCGADLGFMIQNMPLSKSFPKIFAGTGSCTAVDWKFLGLSIPEWAGVWFLVFGALALWAAWGHAPLRPNNRQR